MHFDELISQIGAGETNQRASEELREVIAKLQALAADTGTAKGSITVQLKLTVQRNGVLEVVPTITTKCPKPPAQKGTAWLTPKGELAFTDPRQGALALRDSPAPSNTIDFESAKKKAGN